MRLTRLGIDIEPDIQDGDLDAVAAADTALPGRERLRGRGDHPNSPGVLPDKGDGLARSFEHVTEADLVIPAHIGLPPWPGPPVGSTDSDLLPGQKSSRRAEPKMESRLMPLF